MSMAIATIVARVITAVRLAHFKKKKILIVVDLLVHDEENE
jgi:hypothetical protein